MMTLSTIRPIVAATIIVLAAGMARAQSPTPGGMPPPPGMSLADSAAMRFPQPIRAGALVGREVLKPVESQNVLGLISDVVRGPDGQIQIVMKYGGIFGFGGRLISVPLDAFVLLGEDTEVVAFTPDQLARFPSFRRDGTQALQADTIITVGLAKPSH